MRAQTKIAFALIASTLTISMLTACTAPEGGADSSASPSSRGPHDSASSSPRPSLAAPPSGDPLGPISEPEEYVADMPVRSAVDFGEGDFARGKPVLNSSGTPVAYVVASGDVAEFIGKRFGLPLAYLNAINGPRRGGALELFAGDTLNLDAHTIYSVGDKNGAVAKNPGNSPEPPQH